MTSYREGATAVAVEGSNQAPVDIGLAERLFDELRRRTGTNRGITRTSYGLGEQIAHDIVTREARKLGLEISTDAGCNLYLTMKGREEGPAIFIGSHLDSVPMGGNFDGAAGVLLGLSVISGYVRAASARCATSPSWPCAPRKAPGSAPPISAAEPPSAC